MFGLDGDVAPLEDIVELARRYDVRVLVDEAQAIGAVGPGGRGAVAEAGLEDEVDVITGSLGKALGSYGGFACCDHVTARFLVNSARTLLHSTAPPPVAVAAAMAALELLDEQPRRVEKLLDNAETLRDELAREGFEVAGASTHIVPLLVGETEPAVRDRRARARAGRVRRGRPAARRPRRRGPRCGWPSWRRTRAPSCAAPRACSPAPRCAPACARAPAARSRSRSATSCRGRRSRASNCGWVGRVGRRDRSRAGAALAEDVAARSQSLRSGLVGLMTATMDRIASEAEIRSHRRLSPPPYPAAVDVRRPNERRLVLAAGRLVHDRGVDQPLDRRVVVGVDLARRAAPGRAAPPCSGAAGAGRPAGGRTAREVVGRRRLVGRRPAAC